MNHPPIISAADLQYRVTAIMARVTLGLIVAAVLGVVIGFRTGWSARSIMLLAGAVASELALFLFVKLIFVSLTKGVRRSITNMFVAFSPLVLHIFACYLVFVDGLWGARLLLQNLSFLHLLACACFVLAGWSVVKNLAPLTQIAKQVSKGNVVADTAG